MINEIIKYIEMYDFKLIEEVPFYIAYHYKKEFFHIHNNVNEPIFIFTLHNVMSISNEDDLKLFKQYVRKLYINKTRKLKYLKMNND
jgi:hypothetical protein